MISLRLFILYLAIISTVKATICWEPPGDLNCSNPSDPGTTGNLAFLALQYPQLWSVGSQIAYDASLELGPAWIGKVPFENYHITISYLFCMTYNDTEPLHQTLRSFKWEPFDVVFDRTLCEPGFIEMALDDESQVKITNFTTRLRQHVLAQGIDYPDRTAWQPPYHITVGLYNTSVTPSSLPVFPHDSIRITLNVFYFGTEPYFATINASSTWIIILSIIGGCLCILLLCGRSLLRCLSCTEDRLF